MTKTFLIFIFIFLHTVLYSQSLNKLFDRYILDYYINKRVPSVTAGVLLNGKIVWSAAKGFSDIENKVPANNQTLYRIASVSKPMTAVAIMQLVEAGRVKLDDDVRIYIPYIKPTKPFTIRQLLNHTSGVRTYYENEFDSKNYFASTREVVLYIMKDSLGYSPGTRYVYSTLGYNLLAAVIENVSGMNYPDYMKKFIFDPAGMNLTIPDYQKILIQNRARGYVRDAYREIQNAPLADLSIKYAGGGILSTSEDLLKFAQSLLDEKLIKRATLDSMLTPTRLSNGKYINYGLGFSFQTDEKGKKFFSHSGGGTGFASNLIIYPEERNSAVYLTNIRDRNLEDPATTLLSIVSGKGTFTVKKALSDRLMDEYIITNIDSILNLYKKIAKDSVSSYDVSAGELIYFGNDLLNINRVRDAISYFKFVLTILPDNSEAYIGLADAYYADGNRGLALKNYRMALKLNPSDNYINDMIEKINIER